MDEISTKNRPKTTITENIGLLNLKKQYSSISTKDMIDSFSSTHEEKLLKDGKKKSNKKATPKVKLAVKNKSYKYRGLGVSKGVAEGILVLSAKTAEEVETSEKMILLCETTSPMDFYGMAKSSALVVGEGAFGSHAAIVARQLGIPAIVGFTNNYSYELGKGGKEFILEGIRFREGDTIHVDGTIGEFSIRRVV